MQTGPNKFRVAALLTVHNRRATTLQCLANLYAQAEASDIFGLDVYVVDDGSTDGTSEAISAQFPNTRIIARGGDLFWSRGMMVAQTVAERDHPDFFLWLNDDVLLDEGSVERLIQNQVSGPSSAIVVGATRDPASGETTYSGATLARPQRSTSLRLVKPDVSRSTDIDTFNGNLVLLPAITAWRVGKVDGRYRHAYGDIDYGLRARGIGVPVKLAPGHYGICPRNSPRGSWQDHTMSRYRRMRALFGPKGIPVRSHWIFVSRHSGWLAPGYFLGSYFRSIGQILLMPRKST